MITETVLRHALSGLTNGSIGIRLWNGHEETYGKGPKAGTIVIHDQSVLADLAQELDLGFAEAYMEGRIEIEGNLKDILELAFGSHLVVDGTSNRIIKGLARGMARATSIKEQRADIHHHYDLGNDFFKLFLDPSMTYSCAYYHTEKDTLESAQAQKVDYVLRKLNLKKGERFLDIGSGWGQMIIQAAKKYGATAHGITMSEEQFEGTQEKIKAEGLEGQVTVALEDYRDHAKSGKTYDKMASIGMFEHVGQANLGVYLDDAAGLLEPGGLFLLHYISQTIEKTGGGFTLKYIFPRGYIPSVREVAALLPDNDFRILDLENLRYHYALTLDAWVQNFEANLDQVRTLLVDKKRLDERWHDADAEKFIRMWRLYLMGSAANFRHGNLELHQFLLSKGSTNNQPLTHEAWYK